MNEGGTMPKIVNQEELLIIKHKLEQVIITIRTYSKVQKPRFLEYLLLMNKNIQICVNCNYQGIEELSKYLYEDWMNACKLENGVGEWYISGIDLDDKAIQNKRFENNILDIDKILCTNNIILRNWYSRDELIQIGKIFSECRDTWESMINNIIEKYGLSVSQILEIPNDIWTYAKFLCITSSENQLVEWFSQEIPAFGYLIPTELVQLEFGEDILRSFMCSIPM